MSKFNLMSIMKVTAIMCGGLVAKNAIGALMHDDNPVVDTVSLFAGGIVTEMIIDKIEERTMLM